MRDAAGGQPATMKKISKATSTSTAFGPQQQQQRRLLFRPVPPSPPAPVVDTDHPLPPAIGRLLNDVLQSHAYGRDVATAERDVRKLLALACPDDHLAGRVRALLDALIGLQLSHRVGLLVDRRRMPSTQRRAPRG
jgi:hypothetical protein